MESAKATSPSPKVCTGANRYYPLTDGLGSVMKTTDGAGAVVNTYTYDVYGKTRATTGTQPNEFRFAGEQVDDSTGLQYLRNRYYDMATGTFISRDPLSHGPAWGGNGYGYAAANPVNGRDPSGLAVVWSSEHQAWMDDQNGALYINEQWVDPKNGAIWTDGGWVDPATGMVWVEPAAAIAAQCMGGSHNIPGSDTSSSDGCGIPFVLGAGVAGGWGCGICGSAVAPFGDAVQLAYPALNVARRVTGEGAAPYFAVAYGAVLVDAFVEKDYFLAAIDLATVYAGPRFILPAWLAYELLTPTTVGDPAGWREAEYLGIGNYHECFMC